MAAPVARAGKPAPSASRRSSPRGPECLNEDQGAPAPRATGSSRRRVDRSLLTAGLGFDGTAAEPLSGPLEPMTVRRAEQAVIAHCDASVREPGLEKPPHARLGRQRRSFDLIRSRCLVLEGDCARCQLEEVVMADGHPEDVRGQIAKGLLATVDRLTVHDPVLWPNVRLDA
jgi:hypothetical protein